MRAIGLSIASLGLLALAACDKSEHKHGPDADHQHERAAPPAAPGAGAAVAPSQPASAALPGADAYACPMHPEVTSATAGKCPKCGMDLVSMKATSTPPTVSVTSTPAKPIAGQPARLVFDVRDGDQKLTAFDVVHEKKLHLLMVTPDLAWFAHEHPELQPDGSFALDFTFPHGGTFRLFSDFKASGKAGAVVPVDIAVGGAPPKASPLVASNLAEARTIGAYRVRVTTPPPAAGQSATLKFLVTRDNKPVKDLEQYLGALGHLVIIHEDGKTFLHSHPEDHVEPHDDTGKPPHTHPSTGEVAFATHFPKPGLYKAWAQFLHKRENVTADFVVDIKASSAAPAAPPTNAHHH
jgi:hypothetical protein